ncbi:ABC transporter permease [Erysipelothrix sp. HDW6C]|uniref:ABC transporter permease n=1 Tax=Erysipelothrix sp. HDW6C TaxID=2714930 RepID=UPI00140BB295|nr:ABC transporter permease [Erysipelothrix sp. HDW6C]QIK69633.1 ABC transporter permease [Erysipelothrix sp. HDW6C]
MEQIFGIIFTQEFAYSVIRLMTPILFASLAALIAQRSGITNMALEGIMLFAALFGVLGSAFTQSAFVGLLCAILVGVIVSLLLAFFKIKMKTDEILAAIAINLLASGATIFLLYIFAGDRGTSTSLASKMLPFIHIPFIEDIPFIGKILSGHNILVYISFVAVFVLHYFLFRTPLGLRIRAVGGNPDAATSVGVSVEKTQYIALMISGILAGFAGAFMSMGYMGVFNRDMTAGRGYIALAAANVGGQTPIGALLASLLFGLFDALGNNLQIGIIPAEFIYMIPYITTIFAYGFASYRKLNSKKRLKKTIAQEVVAETQ